MNAPDKRNQVFFCYVHREHEMEIATSMPLGSIKSVDDLLEIKCPSIEMLSKFTQLCVSRNIPITSIQSSDEDVSRALVDIFGDSD